MNIDEYDYDLYIDKYYNPDAINYDEETFFDVLVNCALLSIQSILPILSRLICTNLCFGVLTSVFSDKLPQQLFHSLSGICGIYLVLTLSSAQGKVMILLLFGLSYICIKFTVIIQRFIRPMLYPYLSSSNLVKCALIAFSILCQHKFLDQETWMEIRGIVMIFSMKMISLVDDIERESIILPSFTNFFGYIFSSANILFGPWISFQDYMHLYRQPTKKNILWVLSTIKQVFISLLFLIISNCFATYLISDESNLLLVSYREALSFRNSHYFISFLSEASMLAAGFKNSKIWKNDHEWRYIVTDPIKIEFPTALAIVVTYWNKPMHDFLKKCKYDNVY
ncbi:unnamed protein product [Acanthoscelides obtectus]|uniref:Protein-serine O-palmitoleoyltransferase porcupine n=1 Tax=Acanthoscelides obtectus TaxID=200917 RepID=A0A9P0Q276_ACAOB|nr:unnamed protein product [Acanthoscelides obtectus]CAK1629240.1 Protein-serine O-palmitoleoyltransferase porcupine [Acanthoscelides obtectus]